MIQSDDELMVGLLYLWTRDAEISVEEMREYVAERWYPDRDVEYSDGERESIARQIVAAARMTRHPDSISRKIADGSRLKMRSLVACQPLPPACL